MSETRKFGVSLHRAVISPFIEWFKMKNEGDVKWLLVSNPIRLTIAHILLESPLTYVVLTRKSAKNWSVILK
ncbi:MAG: hypothetical protein ACUVV4_03725 [Candidatus Bathyarchaeia archaeon]